VREKKFTAMKTNIFLYEAGQEPQELAPRLRRAVPIRAHVDRNVLRNLPHAPGSPPRGRRPDVDLLLDLNFNAKTEATSRSCARSPTSTFLDRDRHLQPEALGHIRARPAPDLIVRDLLGLREFLPYFREQAWT